MSKKTKKKRLFVLDTNVLMHDPSSIFRFQEHDIFVAMVVLEELDRAKIGVSEIARNVRQVSRFLDELISKTKLEDIKKGIPLSAINYKKAPTKDLLGHLLFQTEALTAQLPLDLPGNNTDNTLLAIMLALQKKHPDQQVTLISKDINLRIKATLLELHTEDYYEDQVLQDVDLLYTGLCELPANFWDTHGKNLQSWQNNEKTFYRISGPLVKSWQPNQCLYSPEPQALETIVRKIEDNIAEVEVAKDFRHQNHGVWGIKARNREQNFALNLLMDPDIDFVSLVGTAGTGKTLLTLAAGLTQTLDQNLFSEIIMTRVTVPLGEDIGFLPGTEEEKMTPWMGALMDNLEVLAKPNSGGQWGRAVTADLIAHRIKIRSLNFMRGRTFLSKFVIIDEAQNLTAKQMRALVTRAGPGTKIVCLGNIAQIDTPYLSESTSGLTYVVDRFKDWQHSGHILLTRGERSRLADHASDIL